MQSQEWEERRARIIEKGGHKCSKCGRAESHSVVLQVHHRTYVRLGRERDGDLEVLCKGCHALRHHKVPPRRKVDKGVGFGGVIPVKPWGSVKRKGGKRDGK